MASKKWTATEVAEAGAIISRVAPWILSAPVVKDGDVAATLKYNVGDLVSNGSQYMEDGTLSTRITIYLTMARDLGATPTSLALTRKAAEVESPVGIPAISVKFIFITLCLVHESVILTNTRFRSRDQAGEVETSYMAAFDNVAEMAADAPDSGAYLNIIKLQGALAKFFADVGRQLPRIVNYSFPVTKTSLGIAHRIYQDGARQADIVNENHIVHPAFCPRDVRALAV